MRRLAATVAVALLVPVASASATLAPAPLPTLPPDLQALVAKSNAMTLSSLRELETTTSQPDVLGLGAQLQAWDLAAASPDTYDYRQPAAGPGAQILETRRIGGRYFARYTKLAKCDGGRPWLAVPAMVGDNEPPLDLLGRGPLSSLLGKLRPTAVTEAGPVEVGSQPATEFQIQTAATQELTTSAQQQIAPSGAATTVTIAVDVNSSGLPIRITTRISNESSLLPGGSLTFVDTITLSRFNDRFRVRAPAAKLVASSLKARCISEVLGAS